MVSIDHVLIKLFINTDKHNIYMQLQQNYNVV